jgi:hypothetical protein
MLRPLGCRPSPLSRSHSGRRSHPGAALLKKRIRWRGSLLSGSHTSGTRLSRRFTKPEIRRLRECATAGLRPDQVERVEWLIGELNPPSLSAKLEHAAASDVVVLSPGDLHVLRQLRGARNDIVHGRDWTVPARSDLRKGLGIATRLLLARLNRVPSESSRQRSGEPLSADPSGMSGDGGSGRRPTSSTFTEDGKRRAERATEATMLMIPHMERREPVPGRTQSRIRQLWADATEEALTVGMMRACDVAIKHLARHFLDGSLNEASATVTAKLAAMRTHDVAGFGPQAYDDGSRAVQCMAEAMIQQGAINLPDDLAAPRRILLAFNAALVALLFELAERYEIPQTRAVGNLGQEISTIVPRQAPPA